MLLIAPRGIGSAREKKPLTSDSKRLAQLVGAFEISLVDRFKSLVPAKDEAGSGISLAYLARAVGVLSAVHAFAGSLIDRFDEAALAAYIDRSAKILEICNAASAEIDWLRCRRLHLLLAVRLLSSGTATPDTLRKAGESIHKWNALLPIRERDETILDSEVQNAPREKINGGRSAICAVDAASALVVEALAATFPRTKEDLHHRMKIAGEFVWSEPFEKALVSLHGENFNHSPAVETEAATASAGALKKMIQDKADTVLLRHAVDNLNIAAADLTAAIDRLGIAVDSLFRFTLRTRDIALVDYYHSLAKKCDKGRTPLHHFTVPWS